MNSQIRLLDIIFITLHAEQMARCKMNILNQSMRKSSILFIFIKRNIEGARNIEGVIWCEYKVTIQGSLKKHIESIHEKMKHPCNLQSV